MILVDFDFNISRQYSAMFSQNLSKRKNHFFEIDFDLFFMIVQQENN